MAPLPKAPGEEVGLECFAKAENGQKQQAEHEYTPDRSP